MLHGDIVYRPMGGAEQVLFSVDSTPAAPDAGSPGIDTYPNGPAVPARCGDAIALKLKFVSGGSDYIEISTSLAVP